MIFFFLADVLKDLARVLVNRAVPDTAAEHHAEDHLEDLERKKCRIRVTFDASSIE